MGRVEERGSRRGPDDGSPDLAERFVRSCLRHGEATMFVDGVDAYSGTDVLRRFDLSCAALDAHGVKSGSRLGVVTDAPVQATIEIFAGFALGATVVPLPGSVLPAQLRRTDQLVRLSHLAGPSDSDKVLTGESAWLDSRRLDRADDRAAPIVLDGAATIQLTSGTTGRPSAAVRTRSALASEIAHYQDALDLDMRDVVVSAVPAHHAYGFGLSVLAASLSDTVVHFLDVGRPRMLLRALADDRSALFVTVPSMIRMLAEAANAGGAKPQSDCVTAGTPIDARTAEVVQLCFGGRLAQVYGTTETGPICVRAPVDWHEALRSLGAPLPGVSVELVPPALPGLDDDVGVVSVASPSMTMGYLTDEGVDRGPVASGRFTTGDLAHWNSGGLVLVGRLSTCINVGGVKVSPEEVESVLMEHPEVASALVVGEEDPAYGQRVRAKVTPESVDCSALVEHCARRLLRSHVPHTIEAVAHLPTTPTGKVIRSHASHLTGRE